VVVRYNNISKDEELVYELVLFDVLNYIQAGLKFIGATGELLLLHLSTSPIFGIEDLDI
jgi:hypothetical protein